MNDPFKITAGVLRIVRAMAEAEARDDYEAAEIVQEGLQCWLGDQPTSAAMVTRLLRLCLVSSDGDRGFYRYNLNEDGRELAKDPAYIPRILRHMGRTPGSGDG